MVVVWRASACSRTIFPITIPIRQPTRSVMLVRRGVAILDGGGVFVGTHLSGLGWHAHACVGMLWSPARSYTAEQMSTRTPSRSTAVFQGVAMPPSICHKIWPHPHGAFVIGTHHVRCGGCAGRSVVDLSSVKETEPVVTMMAYGCTNGATNPP